MQKYSCDEEYLEEFRTGKILKYSLLLSVLPRNRLRPVFSFGSQGKWIYRAKVLTVSSHIIEYTSLWTIQHYEYLYLKLSL